MPSAKMTLTEFVNKWNGRGLDYDGAFGFQCMDLYRGYVKEVLGAKQSPPVEGAKDVWTTYLTEVFTRVSNTKENFPKPGDVVIWGTELGQYGHIAVCLDGDANSFTSFDQNFPISSVCHSQKHTYFGVKGWLRPKGSQTPSPAVENPDMVKVDLGGDLGVMEVQAIRSKLMDLERSIKQQMEENTGLTLQVRSLKEARAKLAELLNCTDDFSDIQREVAILAKKEEHHEEKVPNPIDLIASLLAKLLKRK